MKGVRGEREKRQGQIECIVWVKRVHKVNNSHWITSKRLEKGENGI